MSGSYKSTREGGNYSDVLTLKAARRDSISNLTSFGALNLSYRQTQCRLEDGRWTGTERNNEGR